MADKTIVVDDKFIEATRRVKACAAGITALSLAETRLTYTPELLEEYSSLLHEAARYFDGVISGK